MFNHSPPARAIFHLKLQFIRAPKTYLLFAPKMAREPQRKNKAQFEIKQRV